MPNLTLEIHEKQKPIILVYGDNPLIPYLLDEYSRKLKIAYVGVLEQIEQGDDFYRIPKTNARWVKSLEEKLDYAVIFLSEKDDKAIIPSFLEKISNDGTRAAIIINIKNLENFYDVLLEYKKIPSLKFLFIGDVYSESPSFNVTSQTFKIVRKAISTHSITVSHDLEPVFIIYYKDTIVGINQVLFGKKKNDIFYYLFYSEPQTVNSIAYILRRIEPDLEIHYQESEDKMLTKSHSGLAKEIKSRIVAEPIFLDKYFIGFEKSLANFSQDSAQKDTKEEIKDKSRLYRDKIIELSKDVPRRPIFKSLVLSVTTATFLFIVLNITMIGLGLFQLKTSAKAFREGEYKKASSNIRSAASLLDISSPVAKLGAKIARVDFNQVQESVGLMGIAANNLGHLENVTKGLDREALERTISDGIYFYFRSQELKSELNNETLTTLSTLNLPNIISLAQMLPVILGYNEERNYVLLFQNNGELRPTGGFIGSVGELKLKGGKIESFTIQDVYEYDGKLRAHVEPHYVIRRYLQPHLYLRDSNFDPDFQNSASTSALLYNLETDKKIDGVIAINFEAVRRLIEEVGPIELPAYKRTLDGKNTLDFLQTTIDDKFFPGSTQKKDVLTALFNQLILKLEDRNSFVKAARLFPKLMNEKHVLFAFNSSSIQSIFNTLGYGGTIQNERVVAEGIINDFLLINEANIGVNKANINVTRLTEYQVAFENKIKSHVSHTLKNDDDKEYKAYVRVFAPLGSKLTSISFDQEKQNIVPAVTDFRVYERTGFKPPAGLEVDKDIEQRFQVFGFIVSVAPKSTKTIKVTYDNGIALPSDAVIKYSLYLIKQSGTQKYPFTLSLSYGENFAPKEVEGAVLEKDSIVIKRELLADELFDVKLIKR
ncbi:MAG: hypothetical protein A2868_02275 [Candidatus Levybacteria bacterium RIFCSPHIGHO2_01_FULL_40_15b]|nr:MAG: hypothetical protein A2868_02275 [Candidatus Levybacteria bacterium RIFCSPHIGHO2_01_FULL_40_15b]